MQPKIPETIGRYKILNLIGRGGMGVLYRAQDTVLERDVALKMMLIDFSFDQTARERFEREAKAVARLQHHNVVTIHELGQHEGTPYIVMELLGGRDLEAVMRSGEPLPLSSKLEIAAQLCDGLAYAHEQGIVHRDIKPGNVRVLDDGSVKILDFGIAKFAQSSMTQSGAIMGTASYMAPEQILGNPVDGRADLFSAGVLLHELLAGEKPFGGDSPTAVVYQIVHGQAASIAEAMPGLPPELNAIVAKALQKDPNERYASASDMASDLRLVKMILDLPLTTAAPGATSLGTAPLTIADKLHATGSITRLGGGTGGPGAAGGPAADQPEVHKETQPAPAPARSRMGLIAAAVIGGVVILGGGAFLLTRGGDAGAAPDASPAATQSQAATPAPATGAAAGETPGVAATKPADSILISSQPAGARIVFNGTDTGRVTPATIPLGGSESGRVELSLKGFAPAAATLTAADLKRGRREFKLEASAMPVRLTVTGSYPFELRRGGQVISASATTHELTVQPGGAVIAQSDEYLLNESLALDFRTPEASVSIRAAGVLAVFAAVETCSIIVDGRNVGFPPLPRKPIAAGSHEVILRCPDGKEETRKITVAPGERATVTFRSPAAVARISSGGRREP